jgi:hypothetical protein
MYYLLYTLHGGTLQSYPTSHIVIYDDASNQESYSLAIHNIKNNHDVTALALTTNFGAYIKPEHIFYQTSSLETIRDDLIQLYPELFI